MRLFFHGERKILLVSRGRLREFRDPAAAREFVRPLMDDARNRAAVRDLARSAASGLLRWRDHDARDHLADRLAREDLLVVDYTEERVEAPRLQAAPPATPLQDEMAAEPQPPPPAAPASAVPPPAADPMLGGVDQAVQAQAFQQAAAGGVPLCET